MDMDMNRVEQDKSEKTRRVVVSPDAVMGAEVKSKGNDEKVRRAGIEPSTYRAVDPVLLRAKDFRLQGRHARPVSERTSLTKCRPFFGTSGRQGVK